MPNKDTVEASSDRLKSRLHQIIFESDTPAGRWFDIALLASIGISVLVVMLESMASFRAQYGIWFWSLEWFFTALFTLEYLLRLYVIKRPWKYALSFFGLVDLLAILPTYLSLIMGGVHYMLIIRALRLLRIFRIFKLGHFLREGQIIMDALRASRAKITVFLLFVLLLCVIIGSLMYVIEGGYNDNFSNIPRSIYWSIVTLTTVGYGDITPQTPLGQFFSAIVMLLGYAIIAVPTGIVSSAFIRGRVQEKVSAQSCPSCSREGHDLDAAYCKYCGHSL